MKSSRSSRRGVSLLSEAEARRPVASILRSTEAVCCDSAIRGAPELGSKPSGDGRFNISCCQDASKGSVSSWDRRTSLYSHPGAVRGGEVLNELPNTILESQQICDIMSQPEHTDLVGCQHQASIHQVLAVVLLEALQAGCEVRRHGASVGMASGLDHEDLVPRYTLGTDLGTSVTAVLSGWGVMH